ncbi:MAG: 50S ribosomal protein L24 [Bdellovibrionales bacterium]|nr:50S ribosomal protein L24 [Bdellovibrionales bacterium]
MNAVRNTFHVRKDDQVQVIAGKEKGKTAKVLRVYSKTGRVVLEKLNMVKRHVKPSQKNPQGGISEKELPIHVSNVLLVCSKCGKGTRHGVKQAAPAAAKAGKTKTAKTVQKKIRVCKRCGASPDQAKA